MLRLLLGIIIGVYFAEPIKSFLDTTGISQEIEQQYRRYKANNDREEKSNTVYPDDLKLQQEDDSVTY